ncbi:hypothetical protein [Streptomyces sp. NPDC058424]|uniref:hypothetical protein n=1 Tax=Streptomyces sp. NPDC058424 TaxID=3346491 RepID=UPI00366002F1
MSVAFCAGILAPPAPSCGHPAVVPPVVPAVIPAGYPPAVPAVAPVASPYGQFPGAGPEPAGAEEP